MSASYPQLYSAASSRGKLVGRCRYLGGTCSLVALQIESSGKVDKGSCRGEKDK